MGVEPSPTASPARPRSAFRPLLDERILVAESRLRDGEQDDAERRRREHLTGRELSSFLMRSLAADAGVSPLAADRPVQRGPHGEPLFPAGVVGSIAHGAGLVVAAVAARRTGVLSVGVDVHPAGVLPGGLADLVGRPRELRSAPGLVATGNAPAVLFSAKESVFKAWFPLTGAWLEFDDVLIRLRDDGTFQVEHPTTPGVWRGRWLVSGGVVRSSAVITWRAF